MNVLVTGGAGYIGSVVSAQLVRAGHQVLIYDNLSRGHRHAVPDGAELAEGELSDRSRLEELLRGRGVEAVLHFAAFIEAGESMQVPEAYFRNNTANTLSLLEAMLAARVRKLVFSSSAAVYGQPKRVPVQETDAIKPTNAYGASKVLVEQILAWFHQIHGLRYASLRYFNAAGAEGELGESHHPESHLIPRVLQVAMGQQPSILIFGCNYPTPDGTCVRDYIHVSDLADAHLLALQALATRDQLIYNLGNGQGFSVRQVIQTARQVTGCSVPVIEAPRRLGDPATLVAASDKIRRELGWKPKHADLEAIVRSAWKWRQRFPEGYARDIKVQRIANSR